VVSLKEAYQARWKRGKKSLFLVEVRPWLLCMKPATSLEYAVARGLNMTTSSGCSISVK
jgi:hypothetical protein